MHPATLVSAHCARPATGVAGARQDKDIPTAPTLPTPDDARPIVRRPTDLSVAAGYDRAWANPGTLMAQLVLQYSALNPCAPREAPPSIFVVGS